jgi:hypothetical protein
MDLIIFPGKNTPLKRYRPYFPGYALREIKEGDNPDVVLCHSWGIIDALKYCNEHNIRPRIVSMDGSNLTGKGVSAKGFYIFSFRSHSRTTEDDNGFYREQYYYDLPEDVRHYPYMNREIRNRILKLLI